MAKYVKVSKVKQIVRQAMEIEAYTQMDVEETMETFNNILDETKQITIKKGTLLNDVTTNTIDSFECNRLKQIDERTKEIHTYLLKENKGKSCKCNCDSPDMEIPTTEENKYTVKELSSMMPELKCSCCGKPSGTYIKIEDISFQICKECEDHLFKCLCTTERKDWVCLTMPDEVLQKELLEKIDFAINATGQTDDYTQGMCNGMLYVKSLIDGKEPTFYECKPNKDTEYIKTFTTEQLVEELSKRKGVTRYNVVDIERFYVEREEHQK